MPNSFRALYLIASLALISTAAFAQKTSPVPEKTPTKATNGAAPADYPPSEPDSMRGEYVFVEVMPMPGYSFKDTLAKRISYPKEALAAGVSGTVYVSFKVGVDGILRDVKLVKGIGYGCDDEAVRVMRTMPPWKHGQQAGKPVPVRCTIPILFKLPATKN